MPTVMSPVPKRAGLFAAIKVLVVDDRPYMRKVVPTPLTSIGEGTMYEAARRPVERISEA